MFHDNDSQHVDNIEYQLVKNEISFMITKTLFLRYYSV